MKRNIKETDENRSSSKEFDALLKQCNEKDDTIDELHADADEKNVAIAKLSKECAQKDYEISRMKEKLSTQERRIKAKEEIIEQLRGDCKDKCMNIHTLESNMD